MNALFVREAKLNSQDGRIVLFETIIVSFKTNDYTGALTCIEEELTMGAVAEREVTASQDRGALAKMVMTLLDHWKLST